MIEKTEAIVLQTYPFSETSQVVSWLTPGFGRMLTLIKGAKRPRSAFLGQYDLFYTCELVFHMRDPSGVHIARECSPLDSRPALRENWRAAACASAVCFLSARAAVHGRSEHELYALTSDCLDSLSRGGHSVPLLFWHELQVSRLLGVAPNFRTCVVCGATPAPQEPAFFAAHRGGLVCAKCELRAGTDLLNVTPDCREALLRLQSVRRPDSLRTIRFAAEQFLVFRRILGTFIHFHTGISMACRNMVANLMEAGPSAAIVGRL